MRRRAVGFWIVIGRQNAGDGCAKPPLEAAYFRLHKHKKMDVLQPVKLAIFLLNQ